MWYNMMMISISIIICKTIWSWLLLLLVCLYLLIYRWFNYQFSSIFHKWCSMYHSTSNSITNRFHSRFHNRFHSRFHNRFNNRFHNNKCNRLQPFLNRSNLFNRINLFLLRMSWFRLWIDLNIWHRNLMTTNPINKLINPKTLLQPQQITTTLILPLPLPPTNKQTLNLLR